MQMQVFRGVCVRWTLTSVPAHPARMEPNVPMAPTSTPANVLKVKPNHCLFFFWCKISLQISFRYSTILSYTFTLYFRNVLFDLAHWLLWALRNSKFRCDNISFGFCTLKVLNQPRLFLLSTYSFLW